MKDAPAHERRRQFRRKRCGAKARTTGKSCRRWALVGKERCRLHGGKSLTGPANPAWRTGYYSQALPRDVATLARQAKADPELQDLKALLAVLEVDIRRGMESLHTGAASTADAQKALAALRRALADGDLDGQRKADQALGAALDRVAGQDRAWTNLWDLAERKDRLLTGEVNRHKVTADTINADRVANFMVSMIDALREESQDKDLLRRVFARWERIVGLAGLNVPAKGGA